MFGRILVGVDGREGGQDAIALADDLREPAGRLVLVSVIPSHPDESTAGPELPTRQTALGLLEQARAEAGVSAEVRCVAARLPARGLHDLARQEAADLVVIGANRRSPVGRSLMGDDARETLSGAPCAVAVAPAGYRRKRHSIHAVGVAFDGSDDSARAVALARDLAGEFRAAVSACHAISVPLTPFAPGALPLADTIEVLLEEARSEIRSLGVQPSVGYGLPGEVLCQYSASLDLLVLGSHGRGPFGRLVHGSTAHRLARSVRCPLLVVPPQPMSGHSRPQRPESPPVAAGLG